MSAAMMSTDPTPIIAALDIQPTYSAREAAVLLGRSYSWLDQRLRQDQFIRPDGTTVQPLRTPGGYRRFTTAMLKDIALNCYRQHWFSMDKLKSTFRELAIAAYRDTDEPPRLSCSSESGCSPAASRRMLSARRGSSVGKT
jgi:hypothetical protein